MTDQKHDFPIHRATFFNDVKLVAKLIRQGADLYQPDWHGNTALHLAIMLGHRETTSLLLSHNAPVKAKNSQGWSCLMEAISYGDRTINDPFCNALTVLNALRKLKSQSNESMKDREPQLLKVLSDFGDFYMELKWDFYSWIPLLTRMLPSDLCRIYKKGTCLRLDTSLVDFKDRAWERGDISLIFDSSSQEQLIIVDNKAKVFQRVRKEESETELEEQLDVLMSSDIVTVEMPIKMISFQSSMTGWLFKRERTEQVGAYPARYFSIEGLTLETRKRREHLNSDDINNNKAMLQTLKTGNDIANQRLKHRRSLPPPGRLSTTWEDYSLAPAGHPPPLGRVHVMKHSVKQLKATVAMSDHFPLSVEAFLDILQVVAPVKHLNRLRQFCQIRLPFGFPVGIEMPLLATVSAKVAFQKFEFRSDLTAQMFHPPKSYQEDPKRFPRL